ncbi:hypothetical protein [Chryseolinea sp. H1M3-3]|uniref:hypothetical protein n=1 Tax=Chryseolinea sp. H1M3-3 TaxID=3034144 RepID=UPI0023EC7A33|nr:hypothetical protein [Chryseolinea sp. H1M3-3]
MASEKDLELLDQYVSNRLTASDKTAFEQKLASDTSLKNEYKLQQKLVDKIREARVKELKTMFNNVPASALEPNGTSVATQITLLIAVVGAIGAGVYFYMSREENVETQPITQQEQVTQETPQAIEPNQDETPKQEVPAVVEEKESSESVTPAIEKDQEETKVPQAHNGLKNDEEPKGPAPLDIFDPTQEGETANKANPEAKISEAPLSKSSIVVEVDNSNKKFNFHYQFKNGKLYLFGTFEKNLYEIMEFFSGNKRTVFLFYKDNYYLLSEENDTIKPLAPINDPTLLQKLKDYRGAR